MGLYLPGGLSGSWRCPCLQLGGASCWDRVGSSPFAAVSTPAKWGFHIQQSPGNASGSPPPRWAVSSSVAAPLPSCLPASCLPACLGKEGEAGLGLAFPSPPNPSNCIHSLAAS